jgi:hypothetical protein
MSRRFMSNNLAGPFWKARGPHPCADRRGTRPFYRVLVLLAGGTGPSLPRDNDSRRHVRGIAELRGKPPTQNPPSGEPDGGFALLHQFVGEDAWLAAGDRPYLCGDLLQLVSETFDLGAPIRLTDRPRWGGCASPDLQQLAGGTFDL